MKEEYSYFLYSLINISVNLSLIYKMKSITFKNYMGTNTKLE
jgi:hypothetical protein